MASIDLSDYMIANAVMIFVCYVKYSTVKSNTLGVIDGVGDDSEGGGDIGEFLLTCKKYTIFL